MSDPRDLPGPSGCSRNKPVLAEVDLTDFIYPEFADDVSHYDIQDGGGENEFDDPMSSDMVDNFAIDAMRRVISDDQAQGINAYDPDDNGMFIMI